MIIYMLIIYNQFENYYLSKKNISFLLVTNFLIFIAINVIISLKSFIH